MMEALKMLLLLGVTAACLLCGEDMIQWVKRKWKKKD